MNDVPGHRTEIRSHGHAGRIEALVTAATGVGLPVRLRAFDGSEAGPRSGGDDPVVVLRNRRALRHILWQPGELGLARAYVTGDLDVEGDLSEALRRAWRAGRIEGDGTAQRRRANVAHRPAYVPRRRCFGWAPWVHPHAPPARSRGWTGECTAGLATGRPSHTTTTCRTTSTHSSSIRR